MVRFIMVALLALVSGLALPRADAASTTNYSDVWWNPNESGWGVNISQQADFLFVSFFVYGPDRQPFWFTAQLTYVGQGTNGALIFSGDNYVTTGDRFDGPFDPMTKGIRRVGSASFTATSVIAGTLVYTVDGITITKLLVRQTLKTESLAGSYNGGLAFNRTCSDPTFNVTSGVSNGVLTIAHSGSNFQLVSVDAQNDRCTFVGTYVQNGQMGGVTGTYSCLSGGGVVPFSFFEIQSSVSGLMGRFSSSPSMSGVSCTVTGRIGAVRTF